MDSRVATPGRAAAHLAARAVVAGVLVYLAARLLMSTQLYATIALVAGVAGVIAFDLARLIGEIARAAHAPVEEMRARDVERLRELEYSKTLLDTVAAALIVVGDDGRVALVNQAARKLAGAAVLRLQQIAALGTSAASELLALAPGSRQIIRLVDGQQMLAIATQFSAPGVASERLISLQRIAGELDAVELKAWRDVSRVLAHEMMNSLTPIASLSQSLEALIAQAAPRSGAPRDDAWEEITAALDAIKRRSVGLMAFVERYRQIAELPPPQKTAIGADVILTGIERLMSAAFADKAIAYRRQPTAPDVHILADAGLVEQALLNLLRNAIEAVERVPAPSVEIFCELRERLAIISVRDNGPGLDEHARDQLFVPFYTTKPGGCGIGLSFARQVALAHGGQLEWQPNSPRGAIFSLILPALAPRASRPRNAAEGQDS